MIQKDKLDQPSAAPKKPRKRDHLKEFAQALKGERKKAGLTPEQAAKELGFRLPAYEKLEKSDSNPKMGDVMVLVKRFPVLIECLK